MVVIPQMILSYTNDIMDFYVFLFFQIGRFHPVVDLCLIEISTVREIVMTTRGSTSFPLLTTDTDHIPNLIVCLV
ncbi:hypothetical protein A6E15_17845 [Natrinema saccharevitans]|uniref:Uncharacterized protein n=1 Tax=Natrinema saccharevitans TaxID=301967 RepID=A0A1S8ARX3_9EURY|nr:hypothetical protein A6E15_17845 [Natrinema saccharevitans]